MVWSEDQRVIAGENQWTVWSHHVQMTRLTTSINNHHNITALSHAYSTNCKETANLMPTKTQHENLKNGYKKLLTFTKLNPMKIKPGLVVFYTIQPGNRSGLPTLQLLVLHRGFCKIKTR